jgi:alcohol dehydrogenase
MQLGASFAGLAIENSMLGAAHALANPLTVAYNIVHGEAVALMLPHVIRFNGHVFTDRYHELLHATGDAEDVPTAADGVGGLAAFIEQLRQQAGLKQRLSECGVQRERLPELAADAVKQWTGTFNPRELTQTDLLRLYEQAF